MIEAFRHDAGAVYHIIKRCLVECPAFVNGSAEHTRCCAKEACNDVISIGRSLHHIMSTLHAAKWFNNMFNDMLLEELDVQRS